MPWRIWIPVYSLGWVWAWEIPQMIKKIIAVAKMRIGFFMGILVFGEMHLVSSPFIFV
jgi:hypothetical protein